jgi:pyruvate/2-oxoglutarate dehydrogenase complex dihydrolipoamide dehydrogenase (E3) component
VFGAGRHALELAQACNRLGIDASVVSEEAALPDDDPELAAVVVDRLRAEGIRIRTGVKVGSVSRRKGGIRMVVTERVGGEGGPGEMAVDGSHLLLAAGRSPAVDGLNLAAAGITHDRSGIVVDARLRTTNHGVYAIGDAIAGPALATRAEEQAVAVVRSIGTPWSGPRAPSAAASVTFTDPALASVGMSEAAARSADQRVRILRFPFVENDRAEIERLPAGMIKVVTSERGRVLGAAIVGRDAGELIAPWALAVANRLPVSAMAAFVAAYPTRCAIANQVAALPEARLTEPWPQRIIGRFRRPG